jgi:hypothetical protein
MKLVEKLTMDIFNQCIQHLEKDDNKTKLQDNIINPIILYISEAVTRRIYPYFIFLNTLFILTFVLVIIILIMMIMQRKS